MLESEVKIIEEEKNIIEKLSEEGFSEFERIINGVLEKHGDFNYYEIQEICEDFLNEIPVKIKEVTKLKRLKKYIISEFELYKNEIGEVKKLEKIKEYSLENIPKYLFTGKSKINSNLINIENIFKNIGLTNLFEGANFKINKGEKIALIGKNGSGKTTLLKIILAKLENNLEKFGLTNLEGTGTITIAPNLKIGYLSQDLFWKSEKKTLKQEMLEIFPEITKKINRLEEIKNNDNSEEKQEEEKLNLELLDIDGYKKYDLQLDILKYFGFTDEKMDLNVLSLSGGEQTKVQIAKFLIMEVDLLILDEPTNHLDIEGIIFLEHFCKIWKKSILSISHDIRFINNTSNKICEISHKKIHNYPGNYQEYLIEKNARYEKQLKDYNVQQKQLDETNAYINRFRANSAKASSVQSRVKTLDKIKILEKPVDEKTVNFINIKSEKRLPEIIMKLNNLEVGYEEIIAKLPEEIEIHKNEKIGIIGKNGCGKSTLLKTILGELKPKKGEAIINENLVIGSYSQVLENLNLNSSIIEELGKDYENEKEIRTILGGLLIIGEKVNQQIKTLSGGERAKVALTKMLLVKPDIIVMDEPTNHLDLHSKEVIKKMLENFEGTTLIVSHDRDLLETISNKLWYINNKSLKIFREPEIGFREIFE